MSRNAAQFLYTRHRILWGLLDPCRAQPPLPVLPPAECGVPRRHTTADIDDTFPKGAALRDWLVNVGASTTPGKLKIKEGQNTVISVNATISRRWIYGASPESIQYFTFNTPIGVPEEQQCGRVVFSDIHVSSGDDVKTPFLDGCRTTDLSPQEKALLFMLFDLSACVQPDDEPPVPPK